jgi:transcriptional regulator with XRE-family HTH domain
VLSTDVNAKMMDNGPASSVAALNARIRERLNALGMSEREASRRAGFGVGYVGDLLSGRSKSPEMARLVKLAVALECGVDYLMGEAAMPPARSAQAVANDSAGTSQRLIDLYTAPTLTSGVWVDSSETAVDKVQAIPMLAHVAGAYAYSIPNGHMEPRYYMGEVIYVHPGLPARPGDFVLARRADGKQTVARLEGVQDSTARFAFIAGADAESVPLADLAYMHRIVGSTN